MASIEKIEQLKKTEEGYKEARKKLEEWKKKWEERLDGLKRGRLVQEYEDEKNDLIKEKEKLEESNERWEKLYQELLRGGEGNEQIA